MKKVKYSLLALLAVVSFSIANAQIYTETLHRTYGTPGGSPSSESWAKAAGTIGQIRCAIGNVSIEQRGVEKFSYAIDIAAEGLGGDEGNFFGRRVDDYLDLSDTPIELVAGQEFTISTEGSMDLAPWANGVLFIDWDGNGAFDDHDPRLYDKYGISQVAIVEYADASASPLNCTWTIDNLTSLTEERLVRARIRYDAGINEIVFVKKDGLQAWNAAFSDNGGIPEVTQAQVPEDLYQNFWSVMLYRFMPSARLIRGMTVDITLKLVPNTYSGSTLQSENIVVGAGSVSCSTAEGTAISSAAEFQNFLTQTSGNYYLTQDITLTSLPVSQTTFNGTFDGNGHTITLGTAANAEFSATSKDECFYPYGLTDKAIGENYLGKTVATPNYDMTNYPLRAIAGGFCGVLGKSGIIKNVKVVYAANATYKNNASVAPIFGLVAGINKGRIENVSVDIQQTVTLQNANSPIASTFGGVTGLLHCGIVKHCAVNIDGTLNHTGSSAMQETLTSAFIGRLQAGVVSNVKFSGSGTMSANSAAVANVRNYMGGIAGMTNTPQGEFCGDQSFDKQLKSWGYDNGTVGLDVNNVILSYTGAMNMTNAANNGSYAYHCRGLLFAEVHDTTLVPNLVTQYSALPTIEVEAPAAATLTGNAIPLVSKTKGKYNATIPNGHFYGEENNTPRLMGKLYLYKDGRIPANASLSTKFTNVTTADTELNWAYEVQNITTDGNTACVSFSTPYAVATYTGTNANIQGIESASANVSDLGGAVVKIDPQPAAVAAPTWTWSETATPAPADIETPICGGGGGEVIAPLLTTYCTTIGKNTNIGTDRNVSNIVLNGETITIGEYSSPNFDTYRGNANNEGTAIELTKGSSYTLRVNGGMNWTFITCFADWNADGDFSDAGERIGILPADATYFGPANAGFREFTLNVPADAASAYIPLRVKMAYSCDASGVAFAADACSLTGNEVTNQSVAADVILKVINGTAPTVNLATSGTATSSIAAYQTYYPANAIDGDEGTKFWSNGNPIEGDYFMVDLGAQKTVGQIKVVMDSGDHPAAGVIEVSTNNSTWKQVGSAFTDQATVTIDLSSGETCQYVRLRHTAAATKWQQIYEFYVYEYAGGDGVCRYEHDFGSVAVDDVATYVMKFDETVSIVKDSTLAAPFAATPSGNELTVTYNPSAVASAEAGFRIALGGGEEFPVSLSGTGKVCPAVTFRMGENGGGLLSLDMGKTTSYQTQEIDPYDGQLLTAVPVGPTHIVGWYVSTDDGATWTDAGHTNPDYIYTGSDDAIVEVRFDFEEFEGNFGDTRFTDATNPPYIINSITTTGGIVNVNATDIFTGGGSGEAETAVRAANVSCTISGNSTNGSRYTSNVTATITSTSGSTTFTSSTLQSGARQALYCDKRSETITVERGATVDFDATFSSSWMLGYVYVDWNNDGDFADAGELVGTQMPEGDATDWVNPSAFTIPADAALGTYTLRFICDWNCISDVVDVAAQYSCGRTDANAENNYTATNGGCMADFELHVVASGGVATTSRPHMRYLSDQRLQTLPDTLGAMTHTVTVTMENMTTFPSDARLLCFIDYNYNNYFDFTSSPDGLASSLTPNGELIFVGESNGNAEQTFTFTFDNANITDYGKTRMRFLAATYVDMYGLGPVNQYGNYQPRFDSDGDGIADTYLPLNDNNGTVYTPNNQCRYINYVNVADVNFEVVAYIRAADEYVIRNGESIRLGDLYIESVEDESGLKSGKITFDKTVPYGSLSIEGNIIVRKRIYQDRWHDIAFPITMQGTAGDQGICAVAANSSLQKLPDDKWLLKGFNPGERNKDGGYGEGLYDANKDSLLANTFYEFAADNVGGANLGALDGTNYYWIQFHSLKKGFVITPKKALTHTITYQRDQTSSEYNNRNVFTLYNPYLAPINVQEITTSTDVGWENITWWNAAQNRFVPVSAAENREMPPYYGYWIQFTEGLGTTSDGDEIDVILGDAARGSYAVADHVTFAAKLGKAPTASVFDTPDSYTLGIDAADNASNEYATSSTIVTLTDAGSIDNFRAGYDMPMSFAAASSTVPEIWSSAGSSRMMFNDVQRAEKVTVPVSIRIKSSGEYALRLMHTNDTASLVQLHDKATGATVDLQNDGETTPYLFLADEGDSDRFDLIISKAPTAITELEFVETLEQEGGEAQVFVSDGTLYLKNISTDYSVSVCDVIGREYFRMPITDSEMTLQLPAMRGVYMVNILDKANDLVQSLKVTK